MMKRLINLCFSLSLLVSATAMAQETPTMVSTQAQNRKILIEEFTGIGCGNCPRAHSTSNRIMAQYPDSAFVINIHQGYYAEGRELDLTTDYGDALYEQSGASSFGWPAGTINRHTFAGDVMFVQDNKWVTTAPEVLQMPSYVNVGAKATIDWTTRKLKVETEVYYTARPEATSNFINVALLQDYIPGTQSNMEANPAQIFNGEYYHMHALRDLLTGQWGEEMTDLAEGKLIQKTFEKDLPDQINNVNLKLEDLSVLVFVTESRTEVMNVCKAEITHVGAPVPHIVRLLQTETIPYMTCTPESKAVLRMANILSRDDIKSFTIEATTAAGTQAFDFEPADFAIGKDETFEVGPFVLNWNLRDAVTFRIAKINGEAYTGTEMNTIKTSVVKWGGDVLASQTPASLNIVQDMFGTDITWTLEREGEILMQGGPYRDLETGTKTNTASLDKATSAGCYMLTVFDKNGDGINTDKGEGYIELKDASGAVVSHMDGKYDSSVQIFFRVTGVANEKSLTSAYALTVNPNPVSAADAELSFTTDRAEDLTVTVYSLNGIRMGTPISYRAEAGSQRMILPTSRLQAGLYMVMVQGENGRRAACKFVVR